MFKFIFYKTKLDCSVVFAKGNIREERVVTDNSTILSKPGVYAIYNKRDKKFYIGSTTTSLMERLLLNGCSHRQQVIHNRHRFIEYRHISDFEILILKSGACDERKEEAFYIKFLNSYDVNYGYNRTKSGSFGGVPGNTYGVKNLINQQGTIWITDCKNGVNRKIKRICDKPSGYWPGKNGTSFCKNFNDQIFKIDNRNNQSEWLYLFVLHTKIINVCKSTRNSVHNRLKIALSRFYKIYLIDLDK